MSRDPTIQQLRCFRVVAEELHFGRAARRLHISQPPLSRQIQALERALGVVLFERGSRQMALTPPGAALYVEVVTALERLDRGIGIALQVAEGKSGRLVLGYVEPLGINLLPRALIGFRQLHAGIDLRLLEMHTVDQAHALHDGMIDCGLLRAPANADPGLEFEQVWLDELVVALPQQHRLARHRGAKLDLLELSEEPFIVYEPSLGTGILSATLSGCASAGFTPTVAHSTQSTPMLLSLVAAGDGVALVSGEVARVPRPGVTFAPLAGAGIYSEVLLAWRAGEESTARENLRHLIQRMGITRP